MTTKRPSLTPPTVARWGRRRAPVMFLLVVAASAATACSLLFPFDELSARDAGDAPDALGPTLPVPDASPEAIDATLLDVSVRDANVPDAAKCASCSTGFCTTDPICDYAVFVTKDSVAGNIPPSGGAASADAFCAREASASGIAGIFKAWVSSGGASAAERTKPLARRPYRRLDGEPVALDDVELRSGNLRAPINVASDKSAVGAYAWTGSTASGEQWGRYNCADFATSGGSGVVGSTSATTTSWSFAATASCLAGNHVYCIQTGD
jgi:hypothetical protein